MKTEVKTFSGIVGDVAEETELELVLGSRTTVCEMLSVQTEFQGGSANTYQILIGNVGGFEPTTETKYSSAVTGISFIVTDWTINKFCKTDSSGKLYLRFGVDVMNDNNFEYIITVRTYS